MTPTETVAAFELCLKITGTFEDGAPSYTGVAGDFDGEGLSVGVLQWNAGSGTLQTLLKTIAKRTTWAAMDEFFPRGGMQELAEASPADAIAICRNRFLTGGDVSVVSPRARTCWANLLGSLDGVAAQRELALAGAFGTAQREAALYVPTQADNLRVLAFFFDLVNQQGSMEHIPVVSKGEPYVALTFAASKNSTVATKWGSITESDPLAALLLYYAYERSKLGKPEYQWDTLSRRGAIACRYGFVHGSAVDFTNLLP